MLASFLLLSASISPSETATQRIQSPQLPNDSIFSSSDSIFVSVLSLSFSMVNGTLELVLLRHRFEVTVLPSSTLLIEHSSDPLPTLGSWYN